MPVGSALPVALALPVQSVAPFDVTHSPLRASALARVSSNPAAHKLMTHADHPAAKDMHPEDAVASTGDGTDAKRTRCSNVKSWV